MRVCFISHSGELNGAETILLETIEILRERGLDCRVIVPSNGQFSNRLKDLGIPSAVLPVGWWMTSHKVSLGSQFKAAAAIAVAVLRTAIQVWRWKCDVVYTSTITVCSGAIAAALLRRPHVWHIQEFGPEDHGLMFRFGEPRSVKLLGALSVSCIALSKALKCKFGAYIEQSKISVIYPSMHIAIEKNATALAQSQPAPPDGVFRCIIVGQVAEGKGQEDAINAMATIADWGIAAELIIVGGHDKRYRHHLEEIIRQRGLRERITFVGQVPNAFPFIAKADALLMCSRCEAFGRVTIEGMIAGKPVIGTRSGATAELIQEGRTGLLYTSGDPDDLASRIRQLSQDRQYATHLGANAQSWVAAVFSKERYSTEMAPLLEALRPSTKSEGSDPILSNARSAHRTHELNS